VITFSKKKPLVLVTIGQRGGETEIFLKDGSDFQKNFLNQTYVKNALGTPAETMIKKTSDYINKKQKELNQLRQDEKLYRENKEEKEEEELDLQRRIRLEEEKRQQLQDDPDSDKMSIKEKKTLSKFKKKIKNQTERKQAPSKQITKIAKRKLKK